MYGVFQASYFLYLQEYKGFNAKIKLFSDIIQLKYTKYLGECTEKSDIFIYKIPKEYLYNENAIKYIKFIKYISKYTVVKDNKVIGSFYSPDGFKVCNNQINFCNTYPSKNISIAEFPTIFNKQSKVFNLIINVEKPCEINKFYKAKEIKARSIKYKNDALDILKANFDKLKKNPNLLEIF